MSLRVVAGAFDISHAKQVFTSLNSGSIICGYDADHKEWITINGTPVPVEDSERQGEVSAKIAAGDLSATGANPDLPGFEANNLDRHFGSGGKHDHARQYPGFTKEQYAQRAIELVRSSVGGAIQGYRADDGSIVRFDESTNDFVKSGIRGIRTMFKPDVGTMYFERRLIDDGGTTDD